MRKLRTATIRNDDRQPRGDTRGRHRSRFVPKSMFVLACLFAVFGLPLLAVMLGTESSLERWSIPLVFGVGFAVCIILMKVVDELTNLFVPLLICGSYALQLCMLTLYTLSGYNLVVTTSSFYPSLAQTPVKVCLALLVVPIITTLLVVLMSVFKIDVVTIQEEKLTGKYDESAVVFFLFLAALILILYYPATGAAGIGSYFVRVLWTALAAIPFVAGWYSVSHKDLRIVWIIVIAAALFLALVTGGRGTAFRALAFFFAGWYACQMGQGRVSGKVTGALVLIGSVLLFGFIDLVRGEIGRGAFDLLSTERIVEVYETSTDYLGQETHHSDDRSLLERSLSRPIVWTNIAVIILTDEVVEQRGYENLWNEIKGYTDIAIISGRERGEWQEQGLRSGAAIQYGFRVSVSTSVPMPVLADGWSRSGWSGAFLFGGIVALLLCLFELGIRRFHGISFSVKVGLLCVVGMAAFFSVNSVPLFALARLLFLECVFVFIFVRVVELIRNTVYQTARVAR